MKVFISYSSTDRKIVREIYQLLKDEFEVWIDEESLLAGEEFEREIPLELSNSDVYILMMSKKFWESDFIYNNELPKIFQQAKLGKFIVPFVLDDVFCLEDPNGTYLLHKSVNHLNSLPRCKNGHIKSYTELLKTETKEHLLKTLKDEIKKLPFSYSYFRFSLDILKLLHYNCKVKTITNIEIDNLEVRYIENNKIKKTKKYKYDNLLNEYMYELFRENTNFIEIKNKIFREKEITKAYIENKFGSYLFPSPCLLNKNKIKTSSYEALKLELINNQFIHIFANAGVGKSSAMALLAQDLESESHTAVVYDVFGSGYYKENKRYKKSNFLKQIINEIAILNGLEPINDDNIDLEIKLKEYLIKLNSWKKEVTIIVDAADNAVSASKEAKEKVCFVYELLRYELPPNTKIIVTSRDGARKESIKAPKTTKVLELLPFSQEDTFNFLKHHKVNLEDKDKNRFYKLTNGIGRVCEYAISNLDYFLKNNKVADTNSIFEMVFDDATQELLSADYDYFAILVLMYRGVSLDDYKDVTNLSKDKAEQIIKTLSPGIEVQNNNLIFKDEDFEKFLEDKVEDKEKIHKKIANRVIELDTEYSHRALAYHLSNANMYHELIESALSDLELNNQLLKQEIGQDRIQLAVDLACVNKDYFNISRLFTKAISIKKSQRNIDEFLLDNPELIVTNASKSYAVEFLYKKHKSNPLYFYRLAYLLVDEDREKSRQFIRQAEQAFKEYLKNQDQSINAKSISFRLVSRYKLYGEKVFLEKIFRLWFRLEILQNLPQEFFISLKLSDTIFYKMTKIEQILIAFYTYRVGNKEFYKKLEINNCKKINTAWLQDNAMKIVEILYFEGNNTLASKLLNSYYIRDFTNIYGLNEIKQYEDIIFCYALKFQEIDFEQFKDKRNARNIIKAIYEAYLIYSKCLVGQFTSKDEVITSWKELFESIDKWSDHYIEKYEKDYIVNIKIIILLKIATKFLDNDFITKIVNKILKLDFFDGIEILNFLIQENLLTKASIVAEKYISNIELFEDDLQSKIQSLIECGKIIMLFDKALARDIYKKAYSLSFGINDLISHNFKIIESYTKNIQLEDKAKKELISNLLGSIKPIDKIRYEFKPWYTVHKIATNISNSIALESSIFLDTRTIFKLEDSFGIVLTNLDLPENEKVAFRYILNENSHELLEFCSKKEQIEKIFNFIRKNYSEDKQFKVLAKHKGKYNFIDKYIEIYSSTHKVNYKTEHEADFGFHEIHEGSFDSIYDTLSYSQKKEFFEYVYKNHLVSKRFLALKLSKTTELSSLYQIFFDCIEAYSKEEQEKLCIDAIKNNSYYLKIKNWSGLKPHLFYKYIGKDKVLSLLLETNLNVFDEEFLLETISYEVELLSDFLANNEKNEIIKLNMGIIGKDIEIEKEHINIHTNIEDFLWKLLSHPDKRKRWQAMHTLKELLIINPSKYLSIIDNIFNNKPYENKYTLNFSGIWYLLMTIHRVSFEYPILLVAIEDKLYEFKQNTKHILFKRICKEILLNIDNKKYNDKLKLIAVSKSSKLKCSYLHKENFNSNLMRNSWDTIHYWYTKITSMFDVDMQEIINIADSYLKTWNISIQEMDYKEIEISSFDRDTYLFTENRQGSIPTIERLPIYLEFHLMFFIVNELLNTYPVCIDRYDDGDFNKFEEWISRYYICENHWISETRDEKPQTDLFKNIEDYENIPLEKLINDKENIVLSASVNKKSNNSRVNITIDSILVDKEFSQAVITYFNNFKSYYDYSFPYDNNKISKDMFQKLFILNDNISELENHDIFKRKIYYRFETKNDIEFIQFSDEESEYEDYDYGYIVRASKMELNKMTELENKDIVFEIILEVSKNNDKKVQNHCIYLLKKGEILK